MHIYIILARNQDWPPPKSFLGNSLWRHEQWREQFRGHEIDMKPGMALRLAASRARDTSSELLEAAPAGRQTLFLRDRLC